MLNRRYFLTTSLLAGLATACKKSNDYSSQEESPILKGTSEPNKRFQISLAQWSLHRMHHAGELTNLDFPLFSKKTFGIDAVEYVNGFFKDKAKNTSYLSELKSRTDNEDIKNLLIMCDGEGHIGAKSDSSRQQTVENHKKWVEAAHFLGCHSIRINAYSDVTSHREASKLVVDGLSQLCEFSMQYDINVIVENHGGRTSDGAWLSGVLKSVNLSNCGSLPDFGNFYEYDRYQGLEDLMPFAKGVSAKSTEFDSSGNEIHTDFRRALEIVIKHGFNGYVGIEYSGSKLSEVDGIKATLALLEKLQY